MWLTPADERALLNLGIACAAFIGAVLVLVGYVLGKAF